MAQKQKALYAGTFDPFTYAHHDILMRSLKIFDEITVLIAISPVKIPMLTKQERTSMIKEHFQAQKAVLIDSWEGLIVDYARNHNITSIIRGLRPTGDFESEFQMASMNKQLNSEIETIFLTTGLGNYFISSSLVKELWKHGRNIDDFVPPSILRAMNSRKKIP